MSAPLPDEELAAMGYVTDEYSRAKAKRDRDEIEPQSPDAWYQQKARVADREAATPPKPAPSAEPELPGWIARNEWVQLPSGERLSEANTSGIERALPLLRALLSRAGLAVVKASDVPSAEERKVLEACAAADIETVGGRNRRRQQFMFELQEDTVCRAELARRAAKDKPTDPAEASRRETGDW